MNFIKVVLVIFLLKSIAPLHDRIFAKPVKKNQQNRSSVDNYDLHDAALAGTLTTDDINNPSLINSRDVYGNTLLHCAIFSKNLDLVNALLDAGADVALQDKNGFTALHFAAKVGFDEAIAPLVTKGASVSAKTCNGAEPLHFALTVKTITALVEQNPPANTSCVDAEGNTPLHYAQTDAVAQRLLDIGADPEAKNTINATPLHYAAAKNNLAVLDVLIAHFTPQDSRNEYLNARDVYGCSALFYASGEGMKKLLKAGASITLKNNFSATPLHFAADAVAADILIQGRLDLHAQTVDGLSPLTTEASAGNATAVKKLMTTEAKQDLTSEVLNLAINSGSVETVQALGNLRELIKNDSSFLSLALSNMNKYIALALIKGGSQQDTDALAQAIKAEFLDIASILLKKIKATDKTTSGNYPLHYANSIQAAKLLISKGANPSAVSDNNEVPLHNTTNSALANFYVKNKVNVNAKNDTNQTPLHKAIRANANNEYIDTLLYLGADFKAQDQNNDTPLHYAARTGNELTLRLLIAYAKQHAEKILQLSIDDVHRYIKRYVLLKNYYGETALDIIGGIDIDVFLTSMGVGK